MAEKRQERRPRRKRDRMLLLFVAAALIVMLVIAVTVSIASLIIANRVSNNSGNISANSDRIEQVETTDRNALRGATYRICDREMRDRAEQHLRAGLSPPAVLVRLAKKLDLPATTVRRLSIEAVRKRLPIADCSPNLIGLPAKPLPVKQQEEYVKQYSENKLPRNP